MVYLVQGQFEAYFVQNFHSCWIVVVAKDNERMDRTSYEADSDEDEDEAQVVHMVHTCSYEDCVLPVAVVRAILCLVDRDQKE